MILLLILLLLTFRLCFLSFRYALKIAKRFIPWRCASIIRLKTVGGTASKENNADAGGDG